MPKPLQGRRNADTCGPKKRAVQIWTAQIADKPTWGIVAKLALLGAGGLRRGILARSAVDMRGQFLAHGFCKHGGHAISLEFLVG